eukprot:scaffold11130_cov183-Skeletonema_dohrnii-CCMP3373.AAC.5
MSSESTAAAAAKFSAPVIEADEWADADAAADNPIPFPESEDWDEDEFDANDSAAVEEEQSDEVVTTDQSTAVNKEEEIMPMQQPLLSSSEEDLTVESPSNTEETTNEFADESLSMNNGGESAENDNNSSIACVDDNTTTTANTTSAKLLTTNITSSEKRRQRRERRQMKPEGQQQQPKQQQQPQSPREPPQSSELSAEIADDTAVTEATSPPPTASPQLKWKQRMAERVAQGKVTVKVTPKSSTFQQDDNNDVGAAETPPTFNPHLLITTSNNTVELLIDEDEIQQAKADTINGGILIPSFLENNASTLEDTTPVDKNEARRQRRLVRNNNNEANEKEEKSTLELLVMAEEALGSSSDDNDDRDVEAKVQEEKEITSTSSVDKTTPLLTTETDTPSKVPPRPASPYSLTDDDDDDEDEDVDPIIADRISKALDDARAKREAKLQNDSDNIIEESNELFDVGYNSKDLVNEDEAREMFPTQNAIEISVKEEGEGESSASIAPEAAWDTEHIATLSKALDDSRAHNSRIAKTDDGKPLLQLETAFSDDDDKESLEAASSSSKLMSQKERIAMYTSEEGFGVGEDSSVEDGDLEGDVESVADKTDEDDDDDNDEEEEIGYEDLTNMDHDNDDTNDEISDEVLDQSEIGKINSDNVPTFSVEAFEASKERAQRWSRNPDAVSDIDDESDSYPTRTSGTKAMIGEKKESSAVMIKIPPPPPDKLQQWMESKSIKSTPTMAVSNLKEVELSPPTPKPTTLKEGEVKLNTSPYKITTPKSPTKKKANTIIEELDL